jgi:hypothetical protein
MSSQSPFSIPTFYEEDIQHEFVDLLHYKGIEY